MDFPAILSALLEWGGAGSWERAYLAALLALDF